MKKTYERFSKKSVVEHLEELRKRIFILASFFAIFFFIGLYFSRKFLNFLVKEASNFGVKLISITPTEIFISELKIGFFFALLLLIPFIIYHVLIFVKPGLKKEE